MLAIARHNLLVTVRHSMIVSVQHERLVSPQGWASKRAYADTERETGSVAERASRASKGRTTRLSIAGANARPSRALASKWLRPGGHEGMVDLFKPERARRRQYPLVRLVLGVLRSLLQ